MKLIVLHSLFFYLLLAKDDPKKQSQLKGFSTRSLIFIAGVEILIP